MRKEKQGQGQGQETEAAGLTRHKTLDPCHPSPVPTHKADLQKKTQASDS